ncbi:protein of unknown function [Flavobacteriaceae bacterium MAR_2010_188]|nr:protein of unknown function [Flavobacteriaceae bacterium MAR_2010_188]
MNVASRISLILLLMLFVSCNENEKKTDEQTEEVAVVDEIEGYESYGYKINPDNSVNVINFNRAFSNLKVGDSLPVKINGEVNEVCQAKGCWMKLDYVPGEEVMVKFKDYAFFVPKDIAGKDVILRGVAYVEEMSVEDQKHYAMDEGKSKDEIAAITQPKKTYSFLADGVLVKSE